MHGNRVLDLIFVMFCSHALTHPCGGPRIIICERFVPVNELVSPHITSVQYCGGCSVHWRLFSTSGG